MLAHLLGDKNKVLNVCYYTVWGKSKPLASVQ